MLSKLYKHEFYSLFRSLSPIYAALGLFAVMCRLSSLFEMDNIIYETVIGFSTIFYVFSIIAMFVVGMVIIIIRFYKNLLSNEGYLTLSLPFTPTQHIFCKLICAVAMIILNFFAVLLSLLIVSIETEAFESIIEIFRLILRDSIADSGLWNVIIFITELCIMAILAVFQTTLMFYASMAIGQQFKNRIGGSVLAYIVMYIGMETVTAFCITPFLTVYGDNLEKYFTSVGIPAVMTFLLFPIATYIVFIIVYFLITRYLLNNKLNLE